MNYLNKCTMIDILQDNLKSHKKKADRIKPFLLKIKDGDIDPTDDSHKDNYESLIAFIMESFTLIETSNNEYIKACNSVSVINEKLLEAKRDVMSLKSEVARQVNYAQEKLKDQIELIDLMHKMTEKYGK